MFKDSGRDPPPRNATRGRRRPEDIQNTLFIVAVFVEGPDQVVRVEYVAERGS